MMVKHAVCAGIRRMALVLLTVAATMAAGAAAGLAVTPAEIDIMPVRPADVPAAVPGPILLTVETPSGPRAYDQVALEALGTHVLDARLIWEGEDGLYHGVLLADLLADAGMDGASSVLVRAVDGYSAVIPREDWVRWPLLLATRQDGRPMTVRNKGPLRLLYPLPPEVVLDMPETDSRWVWMVDRIEPEAPAGR